jgi:hypothetical protein
MSGIGRENGFGAIRAFTELKTVVIDLAERMPPQSRCRLSIGRDPVEACAHPLQRFIVHPFHP